MIYLWLYYKVAPRARGAISWVASGALRVLERLRRYSGDSLLEQSGSFRAGEQPWGSDREDYLHALKRLSDSKVTK